MKVWLDIQSRLRQTIRRGTRDLHLALALAELSVRDCSNAGETALTIGRLRRQTHGYVAAENVREECNDTGDVVWFAIRDHQFQITFSQKSRDRRNQFLDTINHSLEESGVAQRLLPLPSEKSAWPIALTSPQSYELAIAAGIIPGRS